MFAVPVMFQLMAKSEEARADFSHVHIISGGAPIPVDVIRKYQEAKGVGFVQGYAMTETLRLTSLDLEDSITKAGSVGKEVFHIELRIVDNDGRDVAPASRAKSGPWSLMYFWATGTSPPKRRSHGRRLVPHKRHGTARRGRFRLHYRPETEMIISSGKTSTRRGGRAIQSLPQVAAAAVAMPDPAKRGKSSRFVTLQDGRSITEEELINALRADRPFQIRSGSFRGRFSPKRRQDSEEGTPRNN